MAVTPVKCKICGVAEWQHKCKGSAIRVLDKDEVPPKQGKKPPAPKQLPPPPKKEK